MRRAAQVRVSTSLTTRASPGDSSPAATALKTSAWARANEAASVTGGRSRLTVAQGRVATASRSILSSSRPARRSLIARLFTAESTVCRTRAASSGVGEGT